MGSFTSLLQGGASAIFDEPDQTRAAVARLREELRKRGFLFAARVTNAPHIAGGGTVSHTYHISWWKPGEEHQRDRHQHATAKFSSVLSRVPAGGPPTGTERQCRLVETSGLPEDLQDFLRGFPVAPKQGPSAPAGPVQQADHPGAPAGRGGVAGNDGVSAASRLVAEDLTKRIDELTLRDFRPETRQYIGASIIGNPCEAYLALSLRGFPSITPDPKLVRVFEEGHRVEQHVLSLLEKAGCKVEAKNPDTNRQWRYSAAGGHIVANLDGYITPPGAERMLLEVKSMNAESFRKFKEHGLHYSHPEYVAQVQQQMGLSGGKRVLVAAYCKDNQSLWFEVIDFDEAKHVAMMDRASKAMFGPARRMAAFEKSWDCQQCFKREACWSGVGTERKCVHCAHAVPDPTGNNGDRRWVCGLTGHTAASPCEHWRAWKPARQGS